MVAAMHQQWETCKCTVPSYYPELVVREFNRLGNDGWEPVGVIPGESMTSLIAKRIRDIFNQPENVGLNSGKT